VYTLHLEITVLGRAPVVDAGPDQTVNEGDAVAFSGGFVDPDQGETHTIAWNFGDGATASGTLTPTHTYSDDGTYTVSLTVTDSGGRAGRDTLTIIANDLGPTAHVESVPSITPPAMFAIDAGEQASFDASHSISNPDEIVSYEWDWNYDRLTGFVASDDVGKVAAHTFSEAGTYTIAMRVTDDDGSTDVATIDIIVNSVATIEASLASAEISGGGGAVVGAEVAIDELYIHHEALALTQFHLASMGAPEEGSSPVIYFPFNEGDGRYIYNEIDRQSGKEPVLQGTLSQTEWIKDEPAYGNGFALSLGQEGFVEIPADSRMDFAWNQDFTLELWVRSTDGTAKRTLVQRKRSDDSLLYSLNLFKGVPLFQLTTTTDSYAIVKGYETIADGTWHHIACVRDMGALKLYVDGDLVNELLPEARIAGAGGGNLSSGEPTYLGEAEEGKEMMGGLVNALYRIGEAIEFRLRITNETGQLAADESPTLLFVQYDFAGVKISSGYIGRLNYRQEEQVYAYSLDTSLYDDGIYEFFLVTDDGLQETLRIMLLEVE
jgi:PKD repeat protein